MTLYTYLRHRNIVWMIQGKGFDYTGLSYMDNVTQSEINEIKRIYQLWNEFAINVK